MLKEVTLTIKQVVQREATKVIIINDDDNLEEVISNAIATADFISVVTDEVCIPVLKPFPDSWKVEKSDRDLFLEILENTPTDAHKMLCEHGCKISVRKKTYQPIKFIKRRGKKGGDWIKEILVLDSKNVPKIIKFGEFTPISYPPRWAMLLFKMECRTAVEGI